jgi:hypothetical protein
VILRRYGTTVQSVVIAFSSVSLTSVGWRRDRALSLSLDEFRAGYEPVREHHLSAEAEGPVQIEAQNALLADLESQMRALEAGLEPGSEVLFIESQRGVDEPRAHEKRKDVIVDGENRFYFAWWVDPPLRVGVYRKRA